MNEQQTFQRAIDDLETGVDRGPDLPTIHQTARRSRRHRRIAQGVGLVAVVATVGAVALVPSGRWSGPSTQTQPPIATGPSGDSRVTPAQPKLPHPKVVNPPLPSGQLSSDAPSVPGGLYFALNDAGWQVSYVHESDGEIDVSYAQAGAELELTQYPGPAYASYYADRDRQSGKQAISILGQGATMWAYGPHDHTAIRTVENDHFLEVRGTGIDVSDYQELLSQLVQTDQAGFAQSLPDGVVTPANRDQAIQHLLVGVETPPGFTAADVRLEGFNDAYQSAAGVAGSVGCAWLDVYDGGTASQQQAAVAALEGSQKWPLLLDIEHQGGYSQVFWSVADQLQRGTNDHGGPLDVAGLRQGIC